MFQFSSPFCQLLTSAFRWKSTSAPSESNARESSGGGKNRSSSSSSMYERDPLLFAAERGQLGRSASLEEDRSREMAAQFEEMLRTGRTHPMFESHLAYRPPFPPPSMMDMAVQREMMMRFLAANPEAAAAARLPHHPAFAPYPPPLFNPFGGLAHQLQAAAAANHVAAAAHAAQLAAAESHRDRHRNRETKSPREHKKSHDKHKDKGVDRERDRRDSPRPSSASGRSSAGSAAERRDSVEQSYRGVDTRRPDDENSRISELSSHSSHGGSHSRAATPAGEEIDVGSPPPKKLENCYSNDRIKPPSSTNLAVSSYMNATLPSSLPAPQTSFNFSVSHLAEPTHAHPPDRKSPMERSGSTGSVASEGSHASEHSQPRAPSTSSSVSHHRASMEHNLDSYPGYPGKPPGLDGRDSSANGAMSSGGVPVIPAEPTVTSTGLYRPPLPDSSQSSNSPSTVSSSQMSHSATVTTTSVTSSASDTSVTPTYSSNKAISSPPRTYEYTHKKFAHRPMTKKERILGGKSASVVPTQVPVSATSGAATSVSGATSSVFPTRPLELKRVTEDPSSPERITKKSRILGVQRPPKTPKVMSSILKEYSFYHRHHRHINQEYLVHMPKGKVDKKAKRRTLVGMPMKRRKKRPRENMYTYPTRTGLRSASKPEDKDAPPAAINTSVDLTPAPEQPPSDIKDKPTEDLEATKGKQNRVQSVTELRVCIHALLARPTSAVAVRPTQSLLVITVGGRQE